jgi:hypothetical protein
MYDPPVGVIFMLVFHTSFPWLPGSYKKTKRERLPVVVVAGL